MQAVEPRRGGADDGALDLPRAARRDQLPRDGAQQRLRDGGGAQRPEPAEAARRLADQRIVREPAQELGVVVLEPEHEPDVLDAGLARRLDVDGAVGRLPGAHRLEPASPAITAV